MLGIVDWVLVASLLFLSLGIGIYQCRSGGKQRTRAEFILNNRRLEIVPTVLSFMVSYQSAISVLGSPAEYYQWGASLGWTEVIGYPLGIILFEIIALPTFYNLGIMSIYEYYHLRYKHPIIKHLMSFLGITKAILYMGVTILGPSIALETMTGLPLEAGIVVITGCCAVYTSLGGVRAVIWTDVVQCVVMVFGLFVVLICATTESGGIDSVIESGRNYSRLAYADLSPAFHKRITLINVLTTFGPVGWSVYGTEQAAYQRYASLPSLNKSRLTLLLLIPLNMFYIVLCYLVGASIFAYFAVQGCDPTSSGDIQSANQILPYFINSYFSPNSGGKGLFLAVIFSASLSSVSSVLSGCAANTWEDHVKPIFTNLDEFRSTVGSRCLVFAFAILVSIVAFACALIEGNLVQVLMTINSGIGGPMLGVFLLASITKHSEWRGALIGCLSGIAFTFWIAFEGMSIPRPQPTLPPMSTESCGRSNQTDPLQLQGIQEATIKYSGIDNLYAISFVWYFPIGCIVTILINLCVYTFIRVSKVCKLAEVDEKYVISFMKILPCQKPFCTRGQVHAQAGEAISNESADSKELIVLHATNTNN